MSKRKSGVDGRKLSMDELANLSNQNLDTLAILARVYDDGYRPIIFTMATEIQKLLTENSSSVKLRGTKLFSSPDKPHDSRNLAPLYKLATIRVKSPPPILLFEPSYFSPDLPSPVAMTFRDWWNRDLIYVAGAISGELTYARRQSLTRLRLVSLIRNKLGAHQAPEMPVLLDELETAWNWLGFDVSTPEGIVSTHDGSLPIVVGPIAAMMRQICHEVLEAYGRIDAAASDPVCESAPK